MRHWLTERPPDFQITPGDHWAKQGLVFAGLGRATRTTRYHDSSPYCNHGALTNMDPATDWVWVPSLNRFALDFDGTNDYVIVTSMSLPDSQDITICAWVYRYNTNTYNRVFNISRQSTYIQLATTNASLGIYDASTTTSSEVAAVSTSGSYDHYCFTGQIGTYAAYLNGAPSSGTNVIGVGASGDANMYIGRRASGSYTNMVACDVMLFRRSLTAGEIAQLADPSNVMLSGLILPPQRRWWPAVSGAAPPANMLYWMRGNKDGNKMGGMKSGKQCV